MEGARVCISQHDIDVLAGSLRFERVCAYYFFYFPSKRASKHMELDFHINACVAFRKEKENKIP